MTIVKTFAALTCAATLLAACSSAPTTPVAATQTNVAAASAPANIKPAAESTVKTVTIRPHLDPKSAISTDRSVYFDYDNFAIKPDYLKLMDRHGHYLAANPDLAIRIEGNADERGGSEYNLALGQKRAESVLRSLKVYGVKDSQMEAVSWGKTKPRAPGHDEASWAQNRRVDLAYPAK